jgi:hypothetical protein
VVIERLVAFHEADAAACLDALYQDRYPVLESETGRERVFRMMPAHAPGVRADPGLERVARSMFGVVPEEMHSHRDLETWCGQVLRMRSFSHTWALLAWSLWLSEGRVGERPLVIHLDHHDDLGAPPLVCTGDPGTFRTPIGGRTVSVADPATVEAAILAGFVGIGTFVVPFLHTIGGFDLLSIFPAFPGLPGGASSAVALTRKPLVSRAARGERPALGATDSHTPAGTYTTSQDLGLIERLEATGPVLLDVDMDYFCNRLDTEHGPPASRGPGLSEICAEIDELCAALRSNSPLARRVEVVSIALSPGFFPSEYWPDALPRLERGLEDALAAARSNLAGV